MTTNMEFFNNVRTVHRTMVGVCAAVLLFALTPHDPTESVLIEAKEALEQIQAEQWTDIDDEVEELATSRDDTGGLRLPRFPIAYRIPNKGDSLALIRASLSGAEVFGPDWSQLDVTFPDRRYETAGFEIKSGPVHEPLEQMTVDAFDDNSMFLISASASQLNRDIGVPIAVDYERLQENRSVGVTLDGTDVGEMQGHVHSFRLNGFGKFESRLDSVWHSVKDKTPAAALLVIEKRLSSPTQELTLLGLKVDGRGFSVIGPLLSLFMMFHLLSHNGHIPKAKNPQFPWMILYITTGSADLYRSHRWSYFQSYRIAC